MNFKTLVLSTVGLAVMAACQEPLDNSASPIPDQVSTHLMMVKLRKLTERLFMISGHMIF